VRRDRKRWVEGKGSEGEVEEKGGERKGGRREECRMWDERGAKVGSAEGN